MSAYCVHLNLLDIGMGTAMMGSGREKLRALLIVVSIIAFYCQTLVTFTCGDGMRKDNWD